MLTLRRDQIDAMHEYRLQEWWRSRARNRRPELARSDGEPAFAERIRALVERARRGGIEDPDEVGQFIELALHWGEAFDVPEQTPWVARILGWNGTASRLKIAALLQESARAEDERWKREQSEAENR